MRVLALFLALFLLFSCDTGIGTRIHPDRQYQLVAVASGGPGVSVEVTCNRIQYVDGDRTKGTIVLEPEVPFLDPHRVPIVRVGNDRGSEVASIGDASVIDSRHLLVPLPVGIAAGETASFSISNGDAAIDYFPMYFFVNPSDPITIPSGSP